jgi:hypothetical protein
MQPLVAETSNGGMTLTVANRLLEHLSPSDIRLVAAATGKPVGTPSSWMSPR